MDSEKINSLLNAKIYLGDSYFKKDNFEKAYQTYLEAEKIAETMEKGEKIEVLERKLSMTKDSIYLSLEKSIEDLKEEQSSVTPQFREKVTKIINSAQMIGELDIQGKVFEVRGDIAVQENLLSKARNDYLLATKFLREKRKTKRKLENIQRLLAIEATFKEIKILELKNQTEEIERKYQGALMLFETLDKEYQLSHIKNILNSRGEI